MLGERDKVSDEESCWGKNGERDGMRGREERWDEGENII